MIKQLTRIIVLITLCASSLTCAMEPEEAEIENINLAELSPIEESKINPKDIKPTKVESLLALALNTMLKDPLSLITEAPNLPPQLQLMIHEKSLQQIKTYPVKHIVLANFNGFASGPWGFYKAHLTKGEFTDPENEQIYGRVFFIGQKWHTYPDGQLYVHSQKEIISQERFNELASTHNLPYHAPENLKLIIKNPNETKLIVFEESRDKGARITVYNLKTTFKKLTHYENLSAPQLFLVSAIELAQKQKQKLQLTVDEEQLYNDLSPEFKVALDRFVIHRSLL